MKQHFQRPTKTIIKLTRNIFGYCVLVLTLASCASSIDFLVVSDPHFKGDPETVQINRQVVEDMNRLEKENLSIQNETFNPQFVWMLGDITDSGQEIQWQQYEKLYGLTGERLLQYPVFECFGNHDGNVDGIVRNHIKERNPQRSYPLYTDSLGLHYSWDIDQIHFVNLNLYPTNDWDSTCEWCKFFKESFKDSQSSLDFLKQDLEKNVGKSGRPIIIAFHIGFDDFGKKWWTEADRDKFYQIIKDYNITALFHGHNHAVGETTWKGIPVYAAGSSRYDEKIGDYLMVKIDKKGKVYVQTKAVSKKVVN